MTAVDWAVRAMMARNGSQTVNFGAADIGLLADTRVLFPGVGYLGTAPSLLSPFTNAMVHGIPQAIFGWTVIHSPVGAAGTDVTYRIVDTVDGVSTTLGEIVQAADESGPAQQIFGSSQPMELGVFGFMQLTAEKNGALITSPGVGVVVFLVPSEAPQQPVPLGLEEG